MYNAEDYRRKEREVRKLRSALIILSGLLAGFITAYIIQILI